MMDIECELIIFMILRRRRLHRRRRKARRIHWIHPLNLERTSRGLFHTLYDDLQLHGSKFFKYFRMSKNSFNELCDGIPDYIKKQDTIMRKSIRVDERLALTLR